MHFDRSSIVLAWTLLSLAAFGCDGKGAMTDGGADAGRSDCPTNTVPCEGACVATSEDRNNCGSCGNVCQTGLACLDGACRPVCPPSQRVCDGRCADVSTDRAHCGECGAPCESGEFCVGGNCMLACRPGRTICAGRCVDTQSDPAHCGGCGIECEDGEVCNEGHCAFECNEELTDCSGACVDAQNSPEHCGDCTLECEGDTQAIGVCSAGRCRLACELLYGDCNSDLGESGGDGCETPLDTDTTNCGACGRVCELPRAVAGCSAGNCVVALCDTGYDDCDADPSNGCESDLSSDDANCGACGQACPSTHACLGRECIPRRGEDCSDSVALSRGSNSVTWTALNPDFLTTAASCSATAFAGPDVVLSYTATADEHVTLVFDKPTATRWTGVVSTEFCGTLTPELACMSNYDGAALSSSFMLTAGQTAYIYLRDTTDGARSLSNPLEVMVAATDCSSDPAPSAVDLTPRHGGVVSVDGTFRARFDGPVDTTTGTITITGNMGTNLSYDLSTSPAQISFSGGNTILEIDPSGDFQPGESLTIALSGLQGSVCTPGGAISTPTWAVTVGTPSCSPGSGGMVGTVTTRLAGPAITTEYYVAADESPSGWVYVGGTANLWRMPKAGGTAQDVRALAGLTATELGYAMAIAGSNIFVIDNVLSGTEGRVIRISSDGGASWSVEDYATFPTSPNDDFRSVTLYDGRLYLATSDPLITEIWSVDANATTLPTTARLERTLPGFEICAGLARDSAYYYLACAAIGDVLWRIPVAGGPEEIVTRRFDLSPTVNVVHGDDLDADGVFDVLYVQGHEEKVFYVCDPAGETPYASTLVDFGAGTGNFGMGFDRAANRLWVFDDDSPREFISIQ